MKTYSIGNYNFGIQIIFRNIGDYKSELTRRYIRIIFSLLGTQNIIEHRFRNSI